MSRPESGSPLDPPQQQPALAGSLPGSPAAPPAPALQASMGQAFAEMGQALAETAVAPAWRATDPYASVESVEHAAPDGAADPVETASRARPLRQLLAELPRKLANGRKLEKPSRETLARVSIAGFALLVGWSIGAKPWRPRTPAEPVRAALAIPGEPLPPRAAVLLEAKAGADAESVQGATPPVVPTQGSAAAALGATAGPTLAGGATSQSTKSSTASARTKTDAKATAKALTGKASARGAVATKSARSKASTGKVARKASAKKSATAK